MRIISIVVLLFLFQYKCSCQNSPKTKSISIGEIIEFESKILDEIRQIYVYQPKGHWGMDNNVTNLPVIYVLDAESQFNHTASTVDFLSNATNGNDFIPRSLVVGIATINNRDRDLTPMKDIRFPNSGGGSKFLEFITKELIPYIDEYYKSSKHRTIIGHSMGGLLSFEALLRHREYFDNYLIIDPALGYANGTFMNEVIDTLNHSDLSTENVFLAAGNNRPHSISIEDLKSDTSQLALDIDAPNQEFMSIQKVNDWTVNLTTKYYDYENHYSLPHISTNQGLRQLYNYYTFSEMTNYYHPTYKDSLLLVDQIKEHYGNISKKMGYKVEPMQGYINSFAYGLNHFDREDLAIDLLNYNVELNPHDPVLLNNLAYLHMSNGNNKKAIAIFEKSLNIKSDEEILKTINELKSLD